MTGYIDLYTAWSVTIYCLGVWQQREGESLRSRGSSWQPRARHFIAPCTTLGHRPGQWNYVQRRFKTAGLK